MDFSANLIDFTEVKETTDFKSSEWAAPGTESWSISDVTTGLAQRVLYWFTEAQDEKKDEVDLSRKQEAKRTNHVPLNRSKSCSVVEAQRKSILECDESGSEDEDDSLVKYFPVKSSNSLYVEPIILNEVLPQEWTVSQNALLEDRVQGIETSISDFEVASAHYSSENDSDAVYVHRPSNVGSQSELQENIYKNSIKEFQGNVGCSEDVTYTLNRISSRHRRFNFDINVDYTKVASLLEPGFSAALYIEQICDQPNPLISHTMTELSVAALLSFFTPWPDVQCYWVRKMDCTIARLLLDDLCSPKFTETVFLQKFAAVLVVNKRASTLIKDRRCGLIRSLATILQIPTSKLLIIEKTT